MYGGSGKLGRGGGGGRGGGPGKRSIHSTFNAPPPHRPSTAPGGRLSVGGGSAAPRKRTTTASAPTNFDLSAAEETFSLVTGNPLDFAMIIRLTPDLVEEIKRVEAQGGTARIKFDANANNTSGNVIDVGGKDFRFTWSRETGDLCDIYEERQSGEDGKGLLVESGCAWRKMNVQRILDESTKNHVKMRSEEAERKLKSRKAIVLDPGNPSMKSQIKALAAAEVNPWKIPLKQKKESPFKKQKGEPPPVGVHSKSVYKSGLSTTTSSKGRPSASSLPSPPEQSGAPASPPGTSILSKGHANLEDSIVPRAMSKVNASGSEKEIPSRVNSGTVQDKPGHKGNLGAKPTDLRSMLISLLMENPKGMSLKALEKAIGDRIPNSVRQIESIIKKIATFQAPGRYFLKPGVELENFKRPSSESGSSPEDNYHQTPGLDDHYNHMPASEPSFSVGMHNEELGGQAELNAKPGEESNSLEKIDILHHSPDLFGEKKVSDNNEGPAGSSSGSGSESDSGSDSSDSRSDSGSRSRSRSKSGSPVGSGSSSDSESDASSNSKEGSDEDVDIMTSDDDKESKHKLQASEPGLSTSPIPWKTPDGGPVHNKINEKQDSHSSDIVEIERDFPDDDQEAVMAVVSTSVPHKEGEKPVEEIKSSSPHHYEHQVSEVYPINLNSERENMVKDGFKHGQSDSSQKTPKGKSKRGSDGKHFDDNSKRSKRFKAGNLAQPQISRGRNSLFSDNPHNTSPDRPIEGSDKGPANQATTRMSRNGTGSGLQKDYNQSISGKSISDFQQLDRRSIDTSAWAKAPAAVERPGKHVESLGSNIKNSERTRDEGSLTQKEKVTRETKEDADYTDEKKEPIFLKEGGFGDRYTTPIDSHYRNHTKLVEEFKEAGSVSNSHTGLSPRDNNRTDMNRYPVIKGRGSILQRELSDLELGELREPLPEETPGFKKQLERKSSFKQLENKPTTLDYWNSDSGKGKPAGRTTAESRKPSPPHPNVGMLSIPEGLSKKKTPEHHAEGFTSSHNRVVQSQPHHLPIVDHAEFGSHLNKLAEASSKYRHGEAGASQQIGLEGNGESCSKVPVSAKQQGQVTKESKKKKSNSMADLRDRRADNALMDRKDRGRKRKVSSSDENSSYSKYEKEEPELKRPIKDFSQYKEYVQEYGEKYDSYCSLNKILESYRSEFNKLGRDLEMAKGRDTERYCKIVRQLKESYRQCGTRHKRLKKIFIVLHEELVHLKQMIKDYAVSYTID